MYITFIYLHFIIKHQLSNGENKPKFIINIY